MKVVQAFISREFLMHAMAGNPCGPLDVSLCVRGDGIPPAVGGAMIGPLYPHHSEAKSLECSQPSESRDATREEVQGGADYGETLGGGGPRRRGKSVSPFRGQRWGGIEAAGGQRHRAERKATTQ